MIRTEELILDDGGRVTRTWSDAGMLIEQNGTGDLYGEAIDPADSGRTYTETNVPADSDGAGSQSQDEMIKELGSALEEAYELLYGGDAV